MTIIISPTTTIAPRPVAAGSGSWLRRAWSGLGGVLSVLVALGGFAAVLVVLATRQAPATGVYDTLGHPVMSVLSGSMTPTIRTGDLIIDNPTTPAAASALHVGQIITFRSAAESTRLFTHRIVAVTTLDGGVAYRTKGDANNAPDSELVTATNVVGLYHARLPAGGYVLNALHTPLVVGLLAMSILLWFTSRTLLAWARQIPSESAKDTAS